MNQVESIPAKDTCTESSTTMPMKTLHRILQEMAEKPAGPEEYHQEGSVLQHTILVMNEMEELRPNDPDAALIALFHDIGKIETPKDDLPNHYDHDELGSELIQSLPDSLLDSESKEITGIVAEQHMRFKKLPEMRASKAIRLVEKLDDTAISAETMLDLVEADAKGREPVTEIDRERYRVCIDAVREADDQVKEQEVANDQHRLQKKIKIYQEILEQKDKKTTDGDRNSD